MTIDSGISSRITRPGDVHPEVAQLVGAGPGEAADHRDRHDQADGGRHELLHGQPGHLGQVAHGGLAGVVLPVGVGHERCGGVPRGVRRDGGHVRRQQQVVLQPLKAVQEQHADRGERQDAPDVRAPLLIGLGVDADQPVEAALDPPVLVAGEDVRDVVAERDVAGGQRGEQQGKLQPARSGATHQNLSGKTRATNRYTVSRTPPMSPIQFSALKALDPLDEKPERGENHDGQTDIEEVPHDALLGVALCAPPGPAARPGGVGTGGGRPVRTGIFQVASRA